MPAWAVGLTILGAIGAGVTILWCAWVVVRGFRHRHDPPLATKPDIHAISEQIKVLEKKVAAPPTYLDGLPETLKETLRAAYEQGRLLQLHGYEAQNAQRHREAVEQFTRALPLAETDSQRAALHILRGNSHLSISDYDNAQTDYEEAIRLADCISPTEEAAKARADALGNLGNVYHARGDLERAEDHIKQALEIDRRIDNPRSQAEDLGNLGNLSYHRGDLERAEEHYQQALEIHRRMDNPLGQAQDLGNLGLVYADRGDLERAEEHHRRALEIDGRIGNPRGEANALGNLGLVYADRGDLERAEEHHKQALEIFRRIANPLGQANALGNLGLLAERRGQPEEARRPLAEALGLYERMGAGGEGPEAVRAALRRLEEAGGEEKPRRRVRKRKGKEPPVGTEL